MNSIATRNQLEEVPLSKLEPYILGIVNGHISPDTFLYMHYIPQSAVATWSDDATYKLPASIDTTCPHCSTFGLHTVSKVGLSGAAHRVHTASLRCPRCKKESTLIILNAKHKNPAPRSGVNSNQPELWIYPAPAPQGTAEGIPKKFAKGLVDAKTIQPINNTAATLLVRSCLQDLLRNHFEIEKRKLEQEIKEFINQRLAPSFLTELLMSLNKMGNVAAHPKKDPSDPSEERSELEVIRDDEAELAIQILEELLKFEFVTKVKIEKIMENVGKPLTEEQP